jgi:superfamily II DNA or RNA helicase
MPRKLRKPKKLVTGARIEARRLMREAEAAFLAADDRAALHKATRACELEPDRVEAWRLRVDIYWGEPDTRARNQRLVSAYLALDRLAALAPIDAFNCGVFCHHLGQPDMASQMFARAVEKPQALLREGLSREQVVQAARYAEVRRATLASGGALDPRGAGARATGGKRGPSRKATDAAPPPPAERHRAASFDGGRAPAPPPPSLELASLQLQGLSNDDVSTSAGATFIRYRLALAGHHLSMAERFDELLCLRAMRGVDEHAYQVETVRRVLRVLRGRALLADEVGLGKTVEAGMILKEFMLRGMVKTALILVPPALVSQWRDELADKFDLRAATTLEAAYQGSSAQRWGEAPLLVASLAAARSKRNRDAVAAREVDMLIVDEAHHAKNRTTETWKLLNRIRSRFVLMLTATPVENDLDELYNLITLLKPGTLGTPAAFKRRYVGKGEGVQVKDPEALRLLLSEVMIRNTRAAADVRLPARLATTLSVPPCEAEVALQVRLIEVLRARYEEVPARRLLGLLMQEAASSLAAVKSTLEAHLARAREAGREAWRLREAEELLALSGAPHEAGKEASLTEFFTRTDEQAIVFTQYRATEARICQRLERFGVPFARFSGGMSAQDKDHAVERMRRGSARALVATGVGGEGRNLHFLRTIINYDLPWNPMTIEQRIGRVHRIGQEREVHVWSLCQAGFTEEWILKVLDEKINLFELVVGELDLVLGQVRDARDFGERVLAILGESREEADIEAGFTRLGDELSGARERYGKIRELDEQLFSDDYEA